MICSGEGEKVMEDFLYKDFQKRSSVLLTSSHLLLVSQKDRREAIRYTTYPLGSPQSWVGETTPSSFKQ